jgi:nitrate reductase gamma subunit
MSSPLLEIGLPLALAVCGLGLVWRASAWFRTCIGPETRGTTPSGRLVAALRGVTATLFSRRVARVLGSFVADALLLRRLHATAGLRWFAHLLVVVGFTVLLLGHALAPVITAAFVPGYQPTLDPYLFLRNLCGAMVLAGIGLLLVARRRARLVRRPPRERAAALFTVLLVLATISGFALEAHKIASPRAFDRMVDQFAGAADAAKLAPLRALWASEFGVAFADLHGAIDPARHDEGRR